MSYYDSYSTGSTPNGYGTPHLSHRSAALSAPPPGVDPLIWSYFVAVDQHHRGAIDVHDLQRALVNGDFSHFDFDTVVMLARQFDVRRTGLITLDEVIALYQYIQQWSEAFRLADRHRTGVIDEAELGAALRNFGFNLEPKTVHLIMNKHASVDLGAGITFDRFIRTCVVVKSLTEGFQRFDPNGTGYGCMSYDDFIDTCMRAP